MDATDANLDARVTHVQIEGVGSGAITDAREDRLVALEARVEVLEQILRRLGGHLVSAGAAGQANEATVAVGLNLCSAGTVAQLASPHSGVAQSGSAAGS